MTLSIRHTDVATLRAGLALSRLSGPRDPGRVGARSLAAALAAQAVAASLFCLWPHSAVMPEAPSPVPIEVVFAQPVAPLEPAAAVAPAVPPGATDPPETMPAAETPAERAPPDTAPPQTTPPDPIPPESARTEPQPAPAPPPVQDVAVADTVPPAPKPDVAKVAQPAPVADTPAPEPAPPNVPVRPAVASTRLVSPPARAHASVTHRAVSAAEPAQAAAETAAPARPAPQVDAAAIARADDLLRAQIHDAVQAAVRYPMAARLMGVTGHARVAFDYRDGQVDHEQLARSAGAPSLDAAALAAVREAHYPKPPPTAENRLFQLLIWVEFRPG